MVAIAFALLVVLVTVVVVVVLALSRGHGGAEPQEPSRTDVGGDLDADLERWVAAGLITGDQSDAILAHERALAALPPPPLPSRPVAGRPARRIPVVAEALGYLGGILAAVGLGLVVARSWPDTSTAGRLALSLVGALALLGAGFLVPEQEDPAFARLRWSLWTASTAATALFVAVVATDGLGVDRGETVALACAAAVTVQSGVLWRWRERPLQQLGALGGLVVATGAGVAEVAHSGAVGLAVCAVGAVYLALGVRRRTPSPLLTEGAGALALVVGAFLSMSEWHVIGLVFAVLSASALLVLAEVRGLAPERSDQILLAVVGGIALLQAGPAAMLYFGAEAGVATGSTVWLVGAVLVAAGALGRVRLPLVVEAVGATMLIGGAAFTGVQSPGFASLFGIATAVGLVALGMVPGQVLMSVFGSIGLLIDVPWAIGWFFPGEGRAPVLLLVAGGLIVAVAVLLARMGGRLRRELGSDPGAHATGRRRGPRTPRTPPPPTVVTP